MAAELFLTTWAVPAVGFLVGRLAIAALRIRWLERLTPASAAASAISGAALLTLSATWLSRVGLPSPRVTVTLAVLLALIAVWTGVGRHQSWRPRGAPWEWLALVGPALLCSLVALLPVLRTGGYSIGNDTITYCAFSEWLQRNAFATPCRWEVDSPVTYYPWLWQRLGYDLGIAHLLGLVHAASRRTSCLLVYPAVSAGGVLLLLAGVFLVSRWVLRLGVASSGLVGLVFALLPHPIYWGHHNGFLQQTYALPAVLLGVALSVRCLALRRASTGAAFLLAVPLAFLVTVYLPLLPVLGAGWIAFVVVSFGRARGRDAIRRWLKLSAWTVAWALLLAAKDLPGLVSRLWILAQGVTGELVPLRAWQFAELATGARVLGVGKADVALPLVTAANRWAMPVYLLLAAGGALAIARRRRSWPLAAPVLALAIGIGYYGMVVRDPWTGQTGHSWNIFKLTQWAFPFLLLLSAAGLDLVARRARTRPRWLAAAFCLLPLSLGAIHWPWSESLGRGLREVIGAPRPLEVVPGLRRQLQQLPPGTLLVMGRPTSHNDWLAAALILLAYPRPILGDWAESSNVPVHPKDRGAAYAHGLESLEGFVPLLAGSSIFETDGVIDLGGGVARLVRPDRPRILYAVNPSGTAPPLLGEAIVTVGNGRTKLVVFSPRTERIDLRFEEQSGTRRAMEAYLSPGDFDRRTVLAALDRGPVARLLPGEDGSVVLPLEVTQGISTVVIVGASEGPAPGDGLMTFRRIVVRSADKTER